MLDYQRVKWAIIIHNIIYEAAMINQPQSGCNKISLGYGYIKPTMS